MQNKWAGIHRKDYFYIEMFVPEVGEWYDVTINENTKRYGIAGRQVKVIDVRINDNREKYAYEQTLFLRRSYIEATVEDRYGYRYDIPHAGTQSLYKRADRPDGDRVRETKEAIEAWNNLPHYGFIEGVDRPSVPPMTYHDTDYSRWGECFIPVRDLDKEEEGDYSRPVKDIKPRSTKTVDDL